MPPTTNSPNQPKFQLFSSPEEYQYYQTCSRLTKLRRRPAGSSLKDLGNLRPANPSRCHGLSCSRGRRLFPPHPHLPSRLFPAPLLSPRRRQSHRQFCTPHPLLPPHGRLRRRPPRRHLPGTRVHPIRAPPPPTPLTVTVCPDDAIPDASESQPFEKLIIETACLARIGGADEARLRLAAAGYGESYARLLAAQALFVDGKVDEAIAAFEELAREDPADYRPLFCQGVLYLVLGREAESESMLERCREVGGDALIVDPAVMVTPTVDAESGEEKSEPEPEPAKV